MTKYMLFKLDGDTYALALEQVERVIQSLEIQSSPLSGKGCLGMINYHGEVIPVYSLRILLGKEDRPVKLEDQWLMANKKLFCTDRILGIEEQNQTVEAYLVKESKIIPIVNLQALIDG